MPLVEAMLGEQLRAFDLIVHRAFAVGTQLGTDEPWLQADERMVWIVRRQVLRDAREGEPCGGRKGRIADRVEQLIETASETACLGVRAACDGRDVGAALRRAA
jgi:hypothetical protein